MSDKEGTYWSFDVSGADDIGTNGSQVLGHATHGSVDSTEHTGSDRPSLPWVLKRRAYNSEAQYFFYQSNLRGRTHGQSDRPSILELPRLSRD